MVQMKHKGDLFSVKVKKEKNGIKRKGKKQNGEKESSEKTQKLHHLSSTDAQPLTYKTLTVGQVLLGCISKVKDYELIISLPHKLMGSVSLAHISRPYTALLSKMKDDDDDDDEVHALNELYHVGQYVVASVVCIEKINDMTKVSLTLMPNEVNFGISVSCLEVGLVLPCAVSSVEDKGYTLDTGIAGINGAFMKKEDTHKTGTVGVGIVLRCVITKKFGPEDSLNLTLSSNPKAVNSATLNLRETTNASLLLPGTAVKTTISKVESEAVTLMLSDLDGIVSPLHLAKTFDTVKQYSVGDAVLARVLYVTPLSKVVHFTLQKGVCSMKSAVNPLKELPIGDIKQVEIYKTSSSGIYMRLNSVSRGFCSGNYISDKSQVLKHISRDYPVGKKVTCRITKYNHLDQLFIVSLQKSILEQQFVTYGELEAGQIVEGVVSGYNDSGALLAISKTISGCVPSLHLSKKKPAIGEQVNARVLKVNPERQHLLLTLKRRLVNAKESIITDYTHLIEGTLTVGYIVKVLQSGLLVAMFNDMKGFVPKSHTGVDSSQDLRESFKEGQVVKCRVLKFYSDTNKITLSFFLDGANSEKPPMASTPMADIEMRSRVECMVDRIEEDVVRVNIVPHHTKAVIPVHHLSDYSGKCELIKEVIREKDIILNAVVFSKSNGEVTLTLKPSVSFWIDSNSSSSQDKQDLVSGESYPGSVCDVKSYGVFVTIPSGNEGSRALVHIKNLILPGKQKDGKGWELGIGQSLYVSFKDRDEKGRPILTSSPKDNVKNATQSSLQLLYSYLKTEDIVMRGLSKCGGDEARLAKYSVGDKVSAVVVEVNSSEVRVKLHKSSVRGIVPSGHQCDKSTLQVGQKVKACVLHVNQEDKILELSLKPCVLLNLHRNKTDKIQIGMTIKCEVVLCKPFFTMAIMKSECKGTVVYVPTVMHMNMVGSGGHSSVNKKCWVVLKHIEGPLVLGILKCHDKGEEVSLTPSHPDIAYSSRGEGKEEHEETISEEGIGEDINFTKTLSEKTVDTATKEKKDANKKRLLKGKEEKEPKKSKTSKMSESQQNKEGEGFVSEESITSPFIKEEEIEDEKDWVSEKPCLTLNSGFVWDVPHTPITPETFSDSDSEDELPKKKSKQMSKSGQASSIREEEQRLHQLELSRLDQTHTPQTANEFETLLQNTPDSSAVWIQFISHHLESAEVDKAKAVSRRALQVIDAQEEEERLNIWTVLLRLEVLYGSEESVTEAYKEALTTASPLKIHLAMAMVYAENNKLKEAEKVYFNISKKFSKELNVWVKCGIFFYTHNMVKEGRHYLDRALHSLDKKEHLALINKFGQLEFQFGDLERGRTMFESLLSTFPKRMDVWAVYVDLLTKAKDFEGARHVLERLTGLKLKVRKMRFVFKKFLAFEKEHGNSQTVEAVKKRVEEFVASTLQ